MTDLTEERRLFYVALTRAEKRIYISCTESRTIFGKTEKLAPSPYLVPERKPSFSPISASGSNFNPQNTSSIPAVKIIAVLDLDEKSGFSFGHYLSEINDLLQEISPKGAPRPKSRQVQLTLFS